MTAQIDHLITQQTYIELTRCAEQAPLAGEAPASASASRHNGRTSAGSPCDASTPGCPLGRSGAASTTTTAAKVPEIRRMTARATPGAASAPAATAESPVLANGTRISLRQVGAGDRAGMAALFARLTPESRYRRFLSPKRELTSRELTFFTDIDHLNHEAVAAVLNLEELRPATVRRPLDPARSPTPTPPVPRGCIA